MKTLELGKATAPLAQYVRGVKKEPMIVMARGKPIAALVYITGGDLESATLSTHPAFIAILRESMARLRTEGGISSEEMRRRLGPKPKARGNSR
jgi:hypothetical protein